MSPSTSSRLGSAAPRSPAVSGCRVRDARRAPHRRAGGPARSRPCSPHASLVSARAPPPPAPPRRPSGRRRTRPSAPARPRPARSRSSRCRLFKRFKLKNGLEVILAEFHDLPLVDVSLVIKAGGGANPPDRPAWPR